MKFVLLLSIFVSTLCFAQIGGEIAIFSTSRGKNSIEFYSKGKNKKEFFFVDSLGGKAPKAFASVPLNKEFQAFFRIDTNLVSTDSVRIVSKEGGMSYNFTIVGNKLILLHPPLKSDELILVYNKKRFVQAVQLYPVGRKFESVRIVPLFDRVLDADSIASTLNTLLSPSGKNYRVVIEKPFLLENFPETRKLRTPSEARERYTTEMRYIRDAYLKYHPMSRSEHLIFVIPGYQNDAVQGFSVQDKTLYFISGTTNMELSEVIFGEFLSSRLPNYTFNEESAFVPHEFWKTLNKEDIVYSYFDQYEDIPAATGIVAYYFWKEDALGNIVLPKKGTRSALSLIKRPYKRNTFSYHLQLDHFWMWTIFSVKSYPFNLLHLLSIIGVSWGGIYLTIRIRRRIKNRWRFKRFFRFLSLPIFFTIIVALNIAMYFVVSLAYTLYEVNAGNIEELRGLSLNAAEMKLRSNLHPRKIEEPKLSSEILVESNKEIELRQRASVLYFEATIDSKQQIEKFRCTDAIDSLKTEHLPKAILAKNHYFVVKYVNDSGEPQKEEVYNYLGINITASLQAKDPARRILVFVNGYRPTSLGSSFEQHVYDVKKNGLEFPNSYNRLYNFDRYQYWQPWNNIDQRFINVFSPTETYYADGHFSVSTSNYRSIINFSSASSTFPKRCKKGKPHHCYYVSTVKSKLFGSRKKKSLNVINYRSNKSGFKKRFENGRVAGRNLLAVLNELPNSSRNDTLFIVAHSMGYAYSLGILDVLRGKINFGSYIIIAPENASAGGVNPKEWKEIWQFGSNFDAKYADAPCLQDGVAPQHGAKNLPASKRVFIPKNLYTHKGFFDSHFIGYYTWIFDLKKGQNGYIKRH